MVWQRVYFMELWQMFWCIDDDCLGFGFWSFCMKGFFGVGVYLGNCWWQWFISEKLREGFVVGFGLEYFDECVWNWFVVYVECVVFDDYILLGFCLVGYCKEFCECYCGSLLFYIFVLFEVY